MSFPAWALPLLRCPHCRGGLRAEPAAPTVIGCDAGHRIDLARHGYLPLLGPRGRTDTGDDAAMVAARARFLDTGHYAPIASAVAGATSAVPADTPIVELGAGTGHYLAAAIGATRGTTGGLGLAVDSSKYALRRAARWPHVAAVLADAWSPLPLRDAVAGAVLSIFAPRDAAEVLRIVRPGGPIVIVTPEPDHLAELREPMGLLAVDADKSGQIVEAFGRAASSAPRRPAHRAAHPPDGQPAPQVRSLRYRVELTRAEALDCAAMGPAARHRTAADLAQRAEHLPERTAVTVAVSITTLTAPVRGGGQSRA